MDEEELTELNEDFELRIALCVERWKEAGIETRGITAGRDAGTASKVSGFINSGKAPDRFRQVRARLGIECTVEYVFAEERYLPLTQRWTMALAEARRRLESG